MAHSPPACDFGWTAAPFRLVATDTHYYDLGSLKGENGLVLAFICNHCPYVVAVIDRIVADAGTLARHGIGFAAICSNDAESHPADSYENMQAFARKHGFFFPYLHDADQSVARAYGAACTPDFFGFNRDLGLQYRGRLDSAGRGPRTPETERELVAAMTQVAETGQGPRAQTPSMGCSIKWKAA